jgi:hypothetical protein
VLSWRTARCAAVVGAWWGCCAAQDEERVHGSGCLLCLLCVPGMLWSRGWCGLLHAGSLTHACMHAPYTTLTLTLTRTLPPLPPNVSPPPVALGRPAHQAARPRAGAGGHQPPHGPG